MPRTPTPKSVRAPLKPGSPAGSARAATREPRPLHLRRVVALREVAPEVFLLTVSREGAFAPGQTVALGADAAGLSRYYSVASGVDDPLMDVLFDLVADGALTPRLARLGPGDPLFVSDPFGSFVDCDGPTVWIATGTGVAPFASMVRSLAARRGARGLEGKTLVQGSRSPDGLCFRELFASRLGSRYVPCCSGEAPNGDHQAPVFRGRVTRWLAAHDLDPASRYMLCGSAEMVVEAREVLMSRGVPLPRIAAEIYF